MVPPPNRLPLVSTVHWLESLEPKKNDWPVSDNTDPGVESTPVRTVVTDVLRVVDAWVSFADALNVGFRVIRLHSLQRRRSPARCFRRSHAHSPLGRKQNEKYASVNHPNPLARADTGG